MAGPGRPALLLGPLAVHPDHRNRGIGSALVCRALTRARLGGYRAVLLVGDAAYYSRFGFTAEQTGGLWMPGRFERDRLLALELRPDALAGARGLIGATGRSAEARPQHAHRRPQRHAARAYAARRLTASNNPLQFGVTRMNDMSLLARFDGPIVMIGFGSIGKGTLPLIERHVAFDREKFVVIAPGRQRPSACSTSARSDSSIRRSRARTIARFSSRS